MKWKTLFVKLRSSVIVGQSMQPNAGEDQAAFLFEMLASARAAASYVYGITFEEFRANEEKRDAVALRLIVVGENARKLNQQSAFELAAIPLGDIRGMRNRIAHNYGKVDFRIVWDVMQEDLPILITELEKYFVRHRLELTEAERAAQAVPSKPRIQPGP